MNQNKSDGASERPLDLIVGLHGLKTKDFDMHEPKDINKNTGVLNWSLYVDCPQCGESNDLASGDHDSENYISAAIFNNQWEKAQGHEVTCEHCQHEFELGKIEY